MSRVAMPEIEQSPEKQAELQILKKRVEGALANPETHAKAKADFEYTFVQLGLPSEEAVSLCQGIFTAVLSGRPLERIEQDILKQFESIVVGAGDSKRTLVDVLEHQLNGRAQKIFSQVVLHLKNCKGKIIDYGAGDGQVTQLLRDEGGLDIEGFDVRTYVNPAVTVPIKFFDGKRLPAPDGAYEAAVLTNVLHHEKDNEKILAELDRVVTKRLVILETVPVGKTEEEMEADKDRTFMNDYLYNRLFHNADVPVPGTFETPSGWIKRLADHGWRLTYQEDLRFDQSIIKDRHYLLVFDR